MTNAAQAPHGAGTRSPRATAVFFSSLRGYDRAWLRGDVVAGLTVWAVLVPEALAYASIAGVSPVVGLYAAPAALVVYALLGSSRQLVVGPMSATAALSAAAIADMSPAGANAYAALTATLAIAVGIAALIAGLLRLGFVANFISEPVLKGFIVGLALTIVIGQLPKLFGIPKEGDRAVEQLRHFIGDLRQANGASLAIGAVSLLIVLGLRRFAPLVPGSLVAVIVGIAAVKLFDLESHGVDIVGSIKSGLPSVGKPDVSFHQFVQLLPAAIGVLLVGFSEGLGAAKTYSARLHYEIDPNRELLGLGGANLGAGLCSGMVVNGSLSKTAVNGDAGANTQLSGLVVAVLTVVTLLFLTGLFSDLPEATLAAVVIAAVIELVDIAALRRLYRWTVPSPGRLPGITARPDFVAAACALAGVLIFGTLPGLAIGVAISFVLLLYRTTSPRVSRLGEVPPHTGQYTDIARHAANLQRPGIAVLRVEAGLFFANAESVRTRVMRVADDDDIRVIVLDAETVAFIDVTAAHMLSDLAEQLADREVRLVIAHGISSVREGLHSEEQGPGAIELYATVEEAVSAV